MNSKAIYESAAIGIAAARHALTRDVRASLIFGANAVGFAAASEMKDKKIERIMIADSSLSYLSIVKKAGFNICNVTDETAADCIYRFFSRQFPTDGVYLKQEGAEKLIQIWKNTRNAFISVVVTACYDEMVQASGNKAVFWVQYIKNSYNFKKSDIAIANRLVEDKRYYFSALM